MNIDLGCYARDKVSGYSGYLTSWHMLYNGAIQYGMQPQITQDKPNEYPKSLCFDQEQLEFVREGIPLTPAATSLESQLNPFHIGDKVRDKVSGFSGIVIELVLFLNGCLYIQFETQKIAQETGQTVKPFVPFQRLELLMQPSVAEPRVYKDKTTKPTGGPVRGVWGTR